MYLQYTLCAFNTGLEAQWRDDIVPDSLAARHGAPPPARRPSRVHPRQARPMVAGTTRVQLLMEARGGLASLHQRRQPRVCVRARAHTHVGTLAAVLRACAYALVRYIRLDSGAGLRVRAGPV